MRVRLASKTHIDSNDLGKIFSITKCVLDFVYPDITSHDYRNGNTVDHHIVCIFLWVKKKSPTAGRTTILPRSILCTVRFEHDSFSICSHSLLHTFLNASMICILLKRATMHHISSFSRQMTTLNDE